MGVSGSSRAGAGRLTQALGIYVVAMSTALRRLHIEVPEIYHRQLMSALSNAGAVCQYMDIASSLITIRAELPTENEHALVSWLKHETMGQGRVVGSECVGDGDA